MNKEFKPYDHAWNYFQFHGNQRMTTFNFFVAISALVAVGSVNLVANPSPTTNYIFLIVLGIFQMILSFLFWKLDCRISFMIKVAEKSLKYFENLSDIDELKVINNEEQEIIKIKSRKTLLFWNKHYSYSNAFNAIFFLFGIIGFAIVLISGSKLI